MTTTAFSGFSDELESGASDSRRLCSQPPLSRTASILDLARDKRNDAIQECLAKMWDQLSRLLLG